MKKELSILLVVVFVFCLLLLSSCSGTSYHSTFTIDFIDVGEGDAALVACDGHYMLIDGGDTNHGKLVREFLRDKGIMHLDILAISHMHEDHIGGLAEALQSINKVDLVWAPINYSSSKPFTDMSKHLHTSITIPRLGESIRLGSAEVTVLDYGSNTDANESMVLLIQYGDTSFLFTGDIEHNMENRLCDKYDDDFPVTLLKVAHHGSDTSTSIRFLRMVQPTYAIISAGSKYGHPSEQTISRLEQADVQIMITKDVGNIHVVSDGEEVRAEGSR